jgi:hypothetical protein
VSLGLVALANGSLDVNGKLALSHGMGIGVAGAYGLYTAAAALSVFFVLRRVHETRGKELEQMEG